MGIKGVINYAGWRSLMLISSADELWIVLIFVTRRCDDAPRYPVCTFVEPLLFSPSRRWAGAVALAHAGVLVVSSSFALRALLMTADSSEISQQEIKKNNGGVNE